jgi:hypothetical protein
MSLWVARCMICSGLSGASRLLCYPPRFGMASMHRGSKASLPKQLNPAAVAWRRHECGAAAGALASLLGFSQKPAWIVRWAVGIPKLGHTVRKGTRMRAAGHHLRVCREAPRARQRGCSCCAWRPLKPACRIGWWCNGRERDRRAAATKPPSGAMLRQSTRAGAWLRGQASALLQTQQRGSS